MELVTLNNQLLMKNGEAVCIEDGDYGFIMIDDNILSSNRDIALVTPPPTPQ